MFVYQGSERDIRISKITCLGVRVLILFVWFLFLNLRNRAGGGERELDSGIWPQCIRQ